VRSRVIRPGVGEARVSGAGVVTARVTGPGVDARVRDAGVDSRIQHSAADACDAALLGAVVIRLARVEARRRLRVARARRNDRREKEPRETHVTMLPLNFAAMLPRP
jgi:hypothetical protein